MRDALSKTGRAPKLFLGSMGLQGGQAGVFIDDVAVGSTRIGCL